MRKYIIFLVPLLFFCFIVEVKPSYAWMTRQQVFDNFIALCNNYPDYCRYEIIGYSVAGNPIYAFHIGKGRTIVIYTGAIHGNGEYYHENRNADVLYYFARWLLMNNSEESNFILKRLKIIIIPIVNVDNFGITRKNLNGVDLNRNFQTNWGSGSSDPNSMFYRGPYALSEPESRALHNYFKKVDEKWYVDFHAYENYGFYLNYVDAAPYQQLISKAQSIASQRGTTFWTTINTGSGGGYAVNDAVAYGAYGMVFETAPSSEENAQTYWKERVINLSLAIAELYGQEGIVLPIAEIKKMLTDAIPALAMAAVIGLCVYLLFRQVKV